MSRKHVLPIPLILLLIATLACGLAAAPGEKEPGEDVGVAPAATPLAAPMEMVVEAEVRVAELEPLEVQARAYTELISGMLKDKVKGLGDAAKGAVEALPTTMSDAEKLEWLNKNAALFQGANGTGVGTPKRKGKSVERGTQPLARVPIKL